LLLCCELYCAVLCGYCQLRSYNLPLPFAPTLTATFHHTTQQRDRVPDRGHGRDGAVPRGLRRGQQKGLGRLPRQVSIVRVQICTVPSCNFLKLVHRCGVRWGVVEYSLVPLFTMNVFDTLNSSPPTVLQSVRGHDVVQGVQHLFSAAEGHQRALPGMSHNMLLRTFHSTLCNTCT